MCESNLLMMLIFSDPLANPAIANIQLYPRTPDPAVQDSRLTVELLDAAATLATPSTDPLVLRTPLAQGPCGGLPTLPSFRYRVRFNDAPGWAAAHAGSPVLETPAFDDITICWQPASGPRVLAWGNP